MMGYYIGDQNNDDNGLKNSQAEKIRKLDYYITHHNSQYKIKEGPTVDGFVRYSKKVYAKIKTPDVFIHPLYVEMQERSPLGIDKAYFVPEIDMLNSTISTFDFYQNYLSQSLPLIFRHGATNYEIYKRLREARRTDTVDEFMGSLYSYDITDTKSKKLPI